MSSQSENDRSLVVGWSPAAALRLKSAVKQVGSQGAVAELAGIARQSLVEIVAGRSVPTNGTFSRLCDVIGASADYVLKGADADPASQEDRAAASDLDMIAIPALTTRAAAGDGSLMWGKELGAGPFRFAEQWLRRSFGSVNGLRMIQVSGDSQLPDLSDGDWVGIDTTKTKFENGLAVVRLDDCLMIKLLQREGHFLQLISRNPIYGPIVIDLSKEQDRIQVIGKSVFQFKAM